MKFTVVRTPPGASPPSSGNTDNLFEVEGNSPAVLAEADANSEPEDRQLEAASELDDNHSTVESVSSNDRVTIPLAKVALSVPTQTDVAATMSQELRTNTPRIMSSNQGV